MKSFARNVLRTASAVVPFAAARGIIGDRPVFPFYHLVSDEDVPHVNQLYQYRRVSEFEADMDFFLRHYAPRSLRELLEAVNNGRPVPAKSFMLSFDDGLREVHDVIAPILKRKGIPATFFLNSAFLDNREMFWKNKASVLAEKSFEPYSALAVTYAQRHLLDEMAARVGIDFAEYLSKQRPYLDTEQVKRLLADGFTIGAHSVDHPLYSEVNIDEQIRQTAESMSMITGKFALGYRAFAFPFTDRGVTRRFFDTVFGGRLVDLTFAGDNFQSDPDYPRNIQRVWMEGHALSTGRKMSAEAMKFGMQTLLGKSKIQRS